MTGIHFANSHGLHFEHCVVSGFSGDNIDLLPSTNANVEISDTISRLAGSSALYSDSPATLTIVIDRCRFEVSGYGVVADRAIINIYDSINDSSASYGFFARGQGGVASMTIEGSVASNGVIAAVAVWNGSRATAHNVTVSTLTFYSTVGYMVESGGQLSIDSCVVSGLNYGVQVHNASVSVANSTIANNGWGIAVGTGGVARLTRNTITKNSEGVHTDLGGTTYSAGDNMVDGNANETVGAITAANKA